MGGEFVLARYVVSQPYGVAANELFAFVSMAGYWLLSATRQLCSRRRAAKVHPMVALHHELLLRGWFHVIVEFND